MSPAPDEWSQTFRLRPGSVVKLDGLHVVATEPMRLTILAVGNPEAPTTTAPSAETQQRPEQDAMQAFMAHIAAHNGEFKPVDLLLAAERFCNRAGLKSPLSILKERR